MSEQERNELVSKLDCYGDLYKEGRTMGRLIAGTDELLKKAAKTIRVLEERTAQMEESLHDSYQEHLLKEVIPKLEAKNTNLRSALAVVVSSKLDAQKKRYEDLLFQTLELLRKETSPRFSDWKDADDWLFSELDFTKSELEEIYAGRDTYLYTGSAKDDESQPSFGGEPLKPEDLHEMAGQPIWLVPIGEADWEAQWRISFGCNPYETVISKSSQAKMYCLYEKRYGETWEAYRFPPELLGDPVTEAVEVCPYCGAENTFPGWDVKRQGYITVCKECGEQIMLCDECLHADDNTNKMCDWHEVTHEHNVMEGHCFRGVTRHSDHQKSTGGVKTSPSHQEKQSSGCECSTYRAMLRETMRRCGFSGNLNRSDEEE